MAEPVSRMGERRSGVADWVQSVSGFGFLVGLLLVAVPFVVPANDATAATTEIVAGLATMALAAWGAWQGRLLHPRRAFAPSVGLMVVGVVIALLVLLVAVPFTHAVVAGAFGVLIFATGATDAWISGRARARHPRAHRARRM